MTNPEAAVSQYDRQRAIAVLTAARLRRLWGRVGDDFDSGWAAVRSEAVATLQLGRAATVHAAIQYTPAVLAETGQTAAPYGALVPAAFLDTEPNGMRVGTTLDLAPTLAKTAVGRGLAPSAAVGQVSRWMTGTSLTMLADTRRDVYQADIIQRPTISGYVRMLTPPSCRDCVILAGKHYRWNTGFQRHPRCDCIHIPASEALAGDLTTDPYAYFRSLSEEEQARVFGEVEAQAIRDGADIYRAVNLSNRGLATAAGNRRYGTPFKRTLEDIYRRDPDRRFVVANMQHHGWITGPQVAGGNILGSGDRTAQILAAGRGRGTYTVGGQVLTTKRAARYDAARSGVRDPLNRATMTAAERRLYDAYYRNSWAQAGYHPNSIGANSADRGLGLRPVTAGERREAEETLRRELALMEADPSSGRRAAPESVRELARILGF